MSGRYLLVFNGLKGSITAKQAQTVLTNQLKLSPQKAQLFLQGKPVFSPVDAEKAKKQQAMFANLGINVQVKAASSPSSANHATQQDQVNQQVLAALDYITTTLIRLEEKVDDLIQNQQQLTPTEELMFPQESDPEWGEELEFDESSKPKNKLKLVWLVVGIGIILCVIAGGLIIYPDLLPSG